jgi:hypothetical protein
MAKEISDYVAEIEKQIGEEPRQYEPSNFAEKGISQASEVWRKKKEIEEFVKPQKITNEDAEDEEEEFPKINGAEDEEEEDNPKKESENEGDVILDIF